MSTFEDKLAELRKKYGVAGTPASKQPAAPSKATTFEDKLAEMSTRWGITPVSMESSPTAQPAPASPFPTADYAQTMKDGIPLDQHYAGVTPPVVPATIQQPSPDRRRMLPMDMPEAAQAPAPVVIPKELMAQAPGVPVQGKPAPQTSGNPVLDRLMQQHQDRPGGQVPQGITPPVPQMERKETLLGKAVEKFQAAKDVITADNPIEQLAALWRHYNTMSTPEKSFAAGVGDVAATTGSALKWLGKDEPGQGLSTVGKTIQGVYGAGIEQKDFEGAKSLVDPEWWATTGARSAAFPVAMAPLAIAGGAAGTAAAGATGLGATGTAVAASLGGTLLSRPVEAAMEAGGVYEEALGRGMTEEQAQEAARKAFYGNLPLGIMDAGELFTALAPIPPGLKSILGIAGDLKPGAKIVTKAATTAAKVAAGGLQEGAEEVIQEAISRNALGDPITWDQEMKNAFGSGAAMGVAMGGAGSAINLEGRQKAPVPQQAQPTPQAPVSQQEAPAAQPAPQATQTPTAPRPEAQERLRKALKGREPYQVTQEAFVKAVQRPAYEQGPEPDLTHINPQGEPGLTVERQAQIALDGQNGAPLPTVNGLTPAAVVYRGQDGKPLAALKFEIDEQGNVASEPTVYVDPSVRRQGIATRLYEAAAEAGFDLTPMSGTTLTEEGARLFHARAVRQAIAEGKKVPAAVRKQYEKGKSEATAQVTPAAEVAAATQAPVAPPQTQATAQTLEEMEPTGEPILESQAKRKQEKPKTFGETVEVGAQVSIPNRAGAFEVVDTKDRSMVTLRAAGNPNAPTFQVGRQVIQPSQAETAPPAPEAAPTPAQPVAPDPTPATVAEQPTMPTYEETKASHTGDWNADVQKATERMLREAKGDVAKALENAKAEQGWYADPKEALAYHMAGDVVKELDSRVRGAQQAPATAEPVQPTPAEPQATPVAPATPVETPAPNTGRLSDEDAKVELERLKAIPEKTAEDWKQIGLYTHRLKGITAEVTTKSGQLHITFSGGLSGSLTRPLGAAGFKFNSQSKVWVNATPGEAALSLVEDIQREMGSGDASAAPVTQQTNTAPKVEETPTPSQTPVEEGKKESSAEPAPKKGEDIAAVKPPLPKLKVETESRKRYDNLEQLIKGSDGAFQSDKQAGFFRESVADRTPYDDFGVPIAPGQATALVGVRNSEDPSDTKYSLLYVLDEHGVVGKYAIDHRNAKPVVHERWRRQSDPERKPLMSYADRFGGDSLAVMDAIKAAPAAELREALGFIEAKQSEPGTRNWGWKTRAWILNQLEQRGEDAQTQPQSSTNKGEEKVTKAGALWEQTRAEAVGETPIIPDVPRPLEKRFGKKWMERPDAADLKREFGQEVYARQKALKAHKEYVERSNAHLAAVRQAVAQGKPVPTEVLADYPGVEEQYGRNSQAGKGEGKQGTLAFAGARPAAPTGGVAPLAPTNRRALAEWLEKKFDVVVAQGGFKQRALGIFKVKEEVIRTKAADDLLVLTHEIGHRMDKQLGLFRLGHDAELLNLGQATSKESYTKADIRKEGVAEFFRLYLVDPTKARQDAPGYFAAFEARLEANPELEQVVSAAQTHLTGYFGLSAYDRAVANTDYGQDIRTKRERVQDAKAWFRDFLDKAYEAVFDDVVGLRMMQDKYAPKQELPRNLDAYEAANRLRAIIPAKVEAWMKSGRTDENGNVVGKSLEQILEPVGKQQEAYFVYADARMALHLHEKLGWEDGKFPDGFRPNEARENAQTLEAAHPEFRAVFQEEQSWFDAAMQETIDAGLTSPEAAAKMREMYEVYVPWYRKKADKPGANKGTGAGRSTANLSSAVQRRKGGTDTLMNPIERRARYITRYLGLAERAKAGRVVVNFTQAFDGAGKVMDEISPPQEQVKVMLGQIDQALQDAGADTDTMDLDAVASVFRTSWRPPSGKPVVIVMEEGKPKFYEVHDEFVYRAMTAMDHYPADLLSKILGPFTNLQKFGITADPMFMAANTFRDTGTAIVLGKGWVPGESLVRGVLNIFGKTELYQKAMAEGLGGNTWYGSSEDMAKKVKKELQDKGANPITVRGALNLLAAGSRRMQALAKHTELVNRLGEIDIAYRQNRRKGFDHDEAMYKAIGHGRRVTVDFTRGGQLSRQVNRYIPFWNPTLQGLDRLTRETRQNPARVAYGLFMGSILPSIVTYLLNRDNEEYDEAKDYERDNYWLLPVFGKGNGFLRIPKPFELGAPGTVVERLLRLIDKEDPSSLDGMATAVASSILPPAMASVYTAPIQWMTNKNLFTGTPVVPQAQHGLPAAQQYGPNTSQLARLVGEKTNLSPRKLDQAAKDLLPGIPTKWGLQLTDQLLIGTGAVEKPPASKQSWLERTGANRFYSQPGVTSTGHSVDRFYSLKGDADKVYNGLREAIKKESGRDVQMNNLTPAQTAIRAKLMRDMDAEERKLLADRTRLNKVADELADIKRRMRLIEDHKTMSGEAKRKEIERLNQLMTQKAKAALPKR